MLDLAVHQGLGRELRGRLADSGNHLCSKQEKMNPVQGKDDRHARGAKWENGMRVILATLDQKILKNTVYNRMGQP